MSQLKSVLKSSALYTILGFLPMAANFFLLPMITGKLDTAQYGLLSVSNMFQGVIAVFMLIGLDAALARFYFRYYKKRKLLHANYSTGFLFIIGMATILLLLMWLFGENLLRLLFKNNHFHFHDYGIVTFLLALSTVIYTILLAYYRNEENVRMYAIIAISTLVLMVTGIVLGVLVFDWKSYGNIWGRTMATTLSAGVFLIYYFWKKPLIFRWKALKPLLKYGIPFVPYFFLLMANSSLDQWIMERKYELNDLGAYNFAFLLASVCSVFTYAIYNAIGPRVYKLMSEDETGYKNEGQVSNLLRLFHLIVLIIIAGEIAVIAPAMHIIATRADYLESLSYVNLLILAWLPHMYYMLYSIPLMFFNKTKFLPLLTLVCLLFGIAANLTLIPIWGIFGVVASTIFIKVMFFLAAWLFSSRLRILHRPYYRLGKSHIVAIVFFVTVIILFLYQQMFPGQNYFILNLIPIGVLTLCILFFFRSEIRVAKEVFRKK